MKSKASASKEAQTSLQEEAATMLPVGPTQQEDQAAADEHPLLGDYTCPTLDIERLGQTLRLWQRAGVTGGVLLGTTRIGKTHAVDDCIKHIRQIMPSPCFATRINWKLSSRPTERTFLGRMLEGLEYALIERRSLANLERALVLRLQTSAHDAGGRRCVLFIDEAHHLTNSDYQWLCHLFNELHDRHIALMVLLIGQPEMRGGRTLLREGGDTQVIGRFMRAEFVFDGIRGDSDLQVLLRWIDDQSEFPAGSGQSYLAPFLPRALGAGFRLDRLAGRLWQTYAAWRPLHKADDHAGMRGAMSMQTFSGTVKTLVQELAQRDAADLQVDDELLSAVMQLTAAQHG
jgi:hypothetical protein